MYIITVLRHNKYLIMILRFAAITVKVTIIHLPNSTGGGDDSVIWKINNLLENGDIRKYFTRFYLSLELSEVIFKLQLL